MAFSCGCEVAHPGNHSQHPIHSSPVSHLHSWHVLGSRSGSCSLLPSLDGVSTMLGGKLSLEGLPADILYRGSYLELLNCWP